MGRIIVTLLSKILAQNVCYVVLLAIVKGTALATRKFRYPAIFVQVRTMRLWTAPTSHAFDANSLVTLQRTVKTNVGEKFSCVPAASRHLMMSNSVMRAKLQFRVSGRASSASPASLTIMSTVEPFLSRQMSRYIVRTVAVAAITLTTAMVSAVSDLITITRSLT